MTTSTQALRHREPRGTPDPLGVLAVLLSTFGFGTLATLTKLAYAANVGVLSLVFWRFSLASLIVVAILPLERRRRSALFGKSPWTTRRRLLAGLAIACFTVNTTLYLLALQSVTVATVAILFYVYPVAVLLLEFVGWRTRPSIWHLLAVSIALVGVLSTLGWQWGRLDLGAASLILLSASCYAGYITLTHHVFQESSPVAITGLIFGSTAVVAGGLLLLNQAAVRPQAPAMLPILAIVLFATLLRVQLFLIGTRRLGPTPAAILGTFEPIASVIIAILVLGETFTLRQSIGGLLVITAVLLIRGMERRKQ